MISEQLQDSAALYVLGQLPDEEALEFERLLAADAELGDFARGLRELFADTALAAPQIQPAPAIRERVLAEIKRPARRGSVVAWLPWAIAASLALLCGWLGMDRGRLDRELAATRAADPLKQIEVYVLEPSKDAPANATASVAWDSARQGGLLRFGSVPRPAPGKDYQLWLISPNQPAPVSGGVVRVDESGGLHAVEFKPAVAVPAVKAFAISLEKEGGVPKGEGPILMVGHL